MFLFIFLLFFFFQTQTVVNQFRSGSIHYFDNQMRRVCQKRSRNVKNESVHISSREWFCNSRSKCRPRRGDQSAARALPQDRSQRSPCFRIHFQNPLSKLPFQNKLTRYLHRVEEVCTTLTSLERLLEQILKLVIDTGNKEHRCQSGPFKSNNSGGDDNIKFHCCRFTSRIWVTGTRHLTRQR